MDFEPIKCKDVETHLAPSSSSVGATRGGPSVRVRNAFCEGHEGPPEGAHGGFGVPEGRSERFCPRPRGRRGSERLPAEGRVAEPPNRRRAPAFPVAGTREARWEPPGVTSACVSPPAPAHTPTPRAVAHAPTLAPGSGHRRACPLVAQGAFTPEAATCTWVAFCCIREGRSATVCAGPVCVSCHPREGHTRACPSAPSRQTHGGGSAPPASAVSAAWRGGVA